MMNTAYQEQVYFHIPAYFDDSLFTPEKNFYSILKYYMMDNIKIIIYGCPNMCTWNGGRYLNSPMYSIEEIELMFLSLINILDIDIQITFTNTLLNENDVYDRLGNAILNICSNLSNHIEILVASPILEKYIRSEYPNLKIARSIIRNTLPTDKELNGIYSTIVLPTLYNHDLDIIKKIAQKCSLEILCDETCNINCPSKEEHYKSYNKKQLYEKLQNSTSFQRCLYKESTLSSQIYPDKINEYISLGVKHFKLSGREDIKKLIGSCAQYMVIPDNRIQMVYDTTNIMNRYFRGLFRDKYSS